MTQHPTEDPMPFQKKRNGGDGGGDGNGGTNGGGGSPSPPPNYGPPPAIAHYNFALEHLRIQRTRSPHADTDVRTFRLRVGEVMYSPYTYAMGDLIDGDYPLSDVFEHVPVGPSDLVSFAYLIVNSGYDASNEGTVLTVLNLLSDVAADITNNYVPGLGTLGNFDTKSINSIMFANCDGVVVIDRIFYPNSFASASPLVDQLPGVNLPPAGQPIPPLTGADLWQITHGGTYTYRETRIYNGTDSAVGCGENSLYYMTWSISPQS